MDPGLIIGLGLLGATLVTAGIIVAYKYVTVWVKWPKVPGFDAVYDPPTINASKLGACLAKSIDLICLHTSIDRGTLLKLLPMVSIDVNPAEKWVDSWGRTIAGNDVNKPGYYALTINASYASLCHELLHAYEYDKTGTTDDAHASWTNNGFFATVDAYQNWLTLAYP